MFPRAYARARLAVRPFVLAVIVSEDVDVSRPGIRFEGAGPRATTPGDLPQCADFYGSAKRLRDVSIDAGRKMAGDSDR
jgi:hypothetical protein